ncbi:MAG: hypothetical protein AAGA36_01750 [Pseudomonadota bacterium]
MTIRSLFVFIFVFMLGGHVAAQMPMQQGPATGPSGAGITGQADDTGLMYADIEFKVTRLIQHPTDGTLRVLMKVSDKTDKPRSVLISKPVSTLLDDIGNVYELVEINGLEICSAKEPWDYEPRNCARYLKNKFKQLSPNVPVPVSFVFAPVEGSDQSMIDMAEIATFTARFVLLDEASNMSVADVTIPNIALP